jgi:predicted GNAT superfamily acetyltransferase
VTVANVDESPGLTEVAHLFDSVWAGASYMPATFLRALAHSGNYVAAAHSENAPVGALVGFLGTHGKGVALHSHMLAVLPDLQNRSIGYALKLHQRAWALERGIETITWTFDPLIGRNAYFNVSRLGAEVCQYLVNFYGVMADSINARDESDRVLAEWLLASDRVIQMSEMTEVREGGSFYEGVVANMGTPILVAGVNGEPVMAPSSDDVLVCTVPPDIAALRRENAELARAWRLALRRMLGGTIRAGYRVVAFDKAGSYILARE